MMAFGWAAIVFGIIVSFISKVYILNITGNDYGFGRYLESDSIDAAETIMWIGIIAIVVGIAAVIYNYITENNKITSGKFNTKKLTEKRMCLKCGNILNKEIHFCPKCGNDMIKQIDDSKKE